jgi:hypothetical protein
MNRERQNGSDEMIHDEMTGDEIALEEMIGNEIIRDEMGATK